MGSVNKCILVGSVGADPVIRTAQDGKEIANFSIATSESWKDKNTGEKKEKSEWHKVVVFNDGLTGVIKQCVKKGSKVYIEGQLQTRKWTDRDGVERYSTEVVLQAFNGKLVLLSAKETSKDSGDDSEDDTPSAKSPAPVKQMDEDEILF